MYYKVVTTDLKSIQNHSNVACTQYVKDDWVHAQDWLLARGYGLCVFDDYDEAIKCADFSGITSRVFECEVQGVLDSLPERALCASHTNPYTWGAQRINTMNLWLKYLRERYIGGPWPKGTRMVESVKLGKEVRMRKPSDFEIGEWVVYGPTGEKGRVKSTNELYVFVVFKCSDNWDKYQDYTGQACKPQELWSDAHAL